MARPLILAHRGDWTSAAENSLAAFVAAATQHFGATLEQGDSLAPIRNVP
jgi:hypothetical protein